MNIVIRISLGLVSSGCLIASSAGANSLMGPFPYDFPARSAESALILYESKKAGSLGGGSDTNIDDYTLYTGSTTSIGNWQQIEQTLSDGATGNIEGTADQSADGSTQSSSTDFNITTNNPQNDEEDAP